MANINYINYLDMINQPSIERAVTQEDLDRNDALRGDHKKVGDMVWFEVEEDGKLKED